MLISGRFWNSAHGRRDIAGVAVDAERQRRIDQFEQRTEREHPRDQRQQQPRAGGAHLPDGDQRQRRRDHADVARPLERIEFRAPAGCSRDSRTADGRTMARRRRAAPRCSGLRPPPAGVLSVSSASGTTKGSDKIAPRTTVSRARRSVRQSRARSSRSEVERRDRGDQVDQQQDAAPQTDHEQQRAGQDQPAAGMGSITQPQERVQKQRRGIERQ